MTTKQLLKLAKIQGWIEKRKGGSHLIYARGQQQITIPYSVKNDFTGKLIAKQLTASC
jgi:predicted RNA binding protein YcfA (HicA-like mRNA interferase family)